MLTNAIVSTCPGPSGAITDYRDADDEWRCACGETVPHLRIHIVNDSQGGDEFIAFSVEPAHATRLAQKLEKDAERLRVALEEKGSPEQLFLLGVK